MFSFDLGKDLETIIENLVSEECFMCFQGNPGLGDFTGKVNRLIRGRKAAYRPVIKITVTKIGGPLPAFSGAAVNAVNLSTALTFGYFVSRQSNTHYQSL